MGTCKSRLKSRLTGSELDLSWRPGESELDRQVRRVANNDPKLKKLFLNGKNIGDEGARALAEALRTNSSLEGMYLAGNGIGSEGARALAEALRFNTSLKNLYLSENVIGSEGARALAEALSCNTSITSLHLFNSVIGDEGARVVADSLRTNSSLTSLNLLRSSIGNEGAKALAEALRSNFSLKELYLSWNRIGDEGTRALADALRCNAFIARIGLIGNRIGDEGVRAFAEALCFNTSLTHLRLKENSTGDELNERAQRLCSINKTAPNPQEATWQKVEWLAGFEDGAEMALSLMLDRLRAGFPTADRRRELFRRSLGSPGRGERAAASVDAATGRALFWLAVECWAAPDALMNVLRAHPSLSACRDVRHRLYPFMLLATVPGAGVGDVMELLLENPTLVESGIPRPALGLVL